MFTVLKKSMLNVVFYIATISMLILLVVLNFNSMNWVSKSGLILMIVGISITSFSSLLIDYLDKENNSNKY